MPTIGVVDDRGTPRRQITRGIELSGALPEDWTAVGYNPLGTIAEYADWIHENDIAALVLDERLQEQQADVEVHVNYNGHEVVDHLRTLLPTFPIFVVSAIPNDPDLLERFADVEAIIPRQTFVDESKNWVPRIVRSGQHFFESNEEKLERMETLSVLVAKGEADEEQQNELNALRAHFQLPYSDQIQSAEQWISDFEENIERLKTLETRIAKFVADSGIQPES